MDSFESRTFRGCTCPNQSLDSTFSEWVHCANLYINCPMGVYNNQEELLTVLRDRGELYFIFLKVGSHSMNELEIIPIHKIHFMYAIGYHGIGSVAEDYLLILNSGTYKIFSDGSCEKIFDNVKFSFYTWKSEIFGRTGSVEWYVSRDEGNIWELIATDFPWGAKFSSLMTNYVYF